MMAMTTAEKRDLKKTLDIGDIIEFTTRAIVVSERANHCSGPRTYDVVPIYNYLNEKPELFNVAHDDITSIAIVREEI